LGTEFTQAPDVIRKFTGQFDFSLDAKGRASIPARIREIVELYGMKSVTLRFFRERGFSWIRAYPTSYYNDEVLGKLSSLEGETLQETFEIMRLTASCQQAKIDAQGRLNIPDEWLKRLSITKEIRFVGMGNFFDIWQPDHFNDFFDAQLQVAQNGAE
jgi:MraZ protein